MVFDWYDLWLVLSFECFLDGFCVLLGLNQPLEHLFLEPLTLRKLSYLLNRCSFWVHQAILGV